MKDRFVFHTLESENPTFLMTTPAEKPSLKLHAVGHIPLIVIETILIFLIQVKEAGLPGLMGPAHVPVGAGPE